MNTYAPVPVRRVIAPQVSLSPFGQMIATLESRAVSTAATHIGRVLFSALPVRQMFADASALIIDAVAKRSQLPFRTQTDAEVIAQATDAKLNVGLLLLYGTPELAADALEREVVGALHRAISVGYCPGMVLSDVAWRSLMHGATDVAKDETLKLSAPESPSNLASWWARPAYFFLAGCVKRGREYVEGLRARATLMSRQNTMRPPGIQVLGGLEFHLRLIEWMEGNTSLAVAHDRVLSLSKEFDDYEALLAVGRSVLQSGVSFRGSDLCVWSDGMFLPWLNTVLLKTALGDEQVSTVVMSPDQAVLAQERLREIEPTELIERVLSQVRARALAGDPDMLVRALVLVHEHVERHLAFLIRSKNAPAPSAHFIDPYLGEMAKLTLTHGSAMEYLDPFGHDAMSEPLPANLMEAIEAALEWRSFDSEELQMLLEGDALPAQVVIRHIDELRESVREQAVATLLDFHPEMVNELLDAGHLAWSVSIAQRFMSHLTASYMKSVLTESLLGEKAFERHLQEYLDMMLALPQKILQEVWDDHSLHGALVGFLGVLLFDSPSCGISQAEQDELHARVPEQFPDYALQAYAQFRSQIYADTDIPEEERTMPRWEETFSSRQTSWDLVTRMQSTFGERLSKMVTQITEEECFKRSVANKKSRDKRVAKFLLRRSRFYGSS
ncbi:MAG: hypothetical protein WC654_06955 [Patescibacteria group bacterium]